MGYYDDEPYYNPEDFLEEYEVNLREIITKAVNEKIKKTIEDLVLEKSRNEVLTKERNEFRTANRNSEQTYKKEFEKALKENTKEVEKKLSCGFTPHDDVWYIKSDCIYSKCEVCGGNYKVKVNVLGKEKEVDCPHCSYGKVNHYNYYPKQDIVSSVYFNYHRKDRNRKDSGLVLNVEKIYLDKYDSSMSQDNLYHTLEECQAACDKRNNKDSI